MLLEFEGAGHEWARHALTYGEFFPDGVKHSIRLNEIFDRGPGKDGKPAEFSKDNVPYQSDAFLKDLWNTSLHARLAWYSLIHVKVIVLTKLI